MFNRFGMLNVQYEGKKSGVEIIETREEKLVCHDVTASCLPALVVA